MFNSGTLSPLMGWGCILYAQEAIANAALFKLARGFFIENKGEWHSDVLYLYRGPGFDAWITRYGLNLTLIKCEKPTLPLSPTLPSWERERIERQHSVLLGCRLLLELEGANPQSLHEGREKKPGYHNYFIGNDPSKHARYVGLYGEVWIKEVYPGISLRYYLEEGQLRWDYIVAPGANPTQIRFRIRGAEKIEVKDQKLVLNTYLGQIELSEMRAYQEECPIPGRFVSEGSTYRLALDSYDSSRLLVIDSLVYSTCIGGSNNWDLAYSIAVDENGQAYVTGQTRSSNYDVTPGAFQVAHMGWDDVFVTKLNASGSALVDSTYVGGGEHDECGLGIFIDKSGQAYVTGWTLSTDYPVTPAALQQKHGGIFDGFVTKLSPDGSDLVFSTFLGGSQANEGSGIAVDESGYIYIAGLTESADYPVTSEAFQKTWGGNRDVIVAKLNADGSALVYSTYVGGSGEEVAQDIAIDGKGQVYITGWTQSSDYDITPNAFQKVHAGEADVFVTKLNPEGSALLYSTYLGGRGEDIGRSIVVDANGQAYVTGYTKSADYDVTSGAFQRALGGQSDAFVTKLNASGTALVYSTYLGGAGEDRGYSIAVDGIGQAYITGYIKSSDYDITPSAYQTKRGEGTCNTDEGYELLCPDVFITKLNAPQVLRWYILPTLEAPQRIRVVI